MLTSPSPARKMPGWGGYDYFRLSQALTAIEPYNIGNNVEILRSFNPAMPLVTTSFARGPWEQHRIWYELLHGARWQSDLGREKGTCDEGWRHRRARP